MPSVLEIDLPRADWLGEARAHWRKPARDGSALTESVSQTAFQPP